MPSKIHRCEQLLAYTFTDPNICSEALQAAGNGVYRAGPRTFRNGNKRLALLGDAALDLVLAEDWYASVDLEGAFSPKRIKKRLAYLGPSPRCSKELLLTL
jgi:hypothetical protein